jgi:hypothetical protein
MTHFLFLQAMSKLVLNSRLTAFVRRFPRVKYVHADAKQLSRQSPKNRRTYLKYGTLVFTTGVAAVYYCQLTNHEKRTLRVTLSGISRFFRFVLCVTNTLICSSWNTFLHSKSTIFWDIMPCNPLKVNKRFGGTYRLRLRNRRISRERNRRESTWQAELCSLFLWNVVGFQWTWHYNPEDSTLYNHHCENLKSYIFYIPSVTLLKLNRLWFKDFCLLGCDALQPSRKILTFWRNLLHSSSRYKMEAEVAILDQHFAISPNHQAGWSVGNSVDLYSRHAQFISWLGYWLFWLRRFVVFLSPSR